MSVVVSNEDKVSVYQSLELDEWRRCFILETCASFASIEDMQKMYEWMKNGTTEQKLKIHVLKSDSSAAS